jgi:peptidoglycan/xylan/chitin deacetylase (PgdA/CDA1 family)
MDTIMEQATPPIKVPILLYHSITENVMPRFRTFTLSPRLFQAHMAYLHERGYTPLTVTQFITQRALVPAALPERPVVITFDDGFADFHTHALPILRRFEFVATLYVATSSIGGMSKWPRRPDEARPMLTWEQLRACGEQGIECGAHSHTHRQMDILSHADALHEITLSKNIIERQLDQPITSFAYPHGYNSYALREQVRAAGFTSACGVVHAMSSVDDDAFALARLVITNTTDVATLAALLGRERPSPAETLYLRMRVPIWRLVRRCSASISSLPGAS